LSKFKHLLNSLPPYEALLRIQDR